MTTNMIRLICLMIVLMPFTVLGIEPYEHPSFEQLGLSVNGLHVNDNDQIVGFRVTLINAFVVSVPNIPIGWFFNVNLPYQWKTEVIAGIVVGAASLPNEEATFFEDFLVIQVTEREWKEGLFDVEVNITIDSSAGNDDIKKTLTFTKKDLVLKAWVPVRTGPVRTGSGHSN